MNDSSPISSRVDSPSASDRVGTAASALVLDEDGARSPDIPVESGGRGSEGDGMGAGGLVENSPMRRVKSGAGMASDGESTMARSEAHIVS